MVNKPVKPVYMTPEGAEKLKQRLDLLTSVKRTETADRIKAAIALGDLSENSEYIEAKNEQGFLEGEIISIKSKLRHVQIINSDDIHDLVVVGAVVKMFDKDNKKEMEYFIVGQNEADPFEGKISNESPIGASLMNKKVGDIIKVQTPRGLKTLEILAIHA